MQIEPLDSGDRHPRASAVYDSYGLEGKEMAEGLILEFDDVGRAQYDAVNAQLGIDMDSGQRDWSTGLVFHAGAAKPGGWVVFEVWESRCTGTVHE